MFKGNTLPTQELSPTAAATEMPIIEFIIFMIKKAREIQKLNSIDFKEEKDFVIALNQLNNDEVNQIYANLIMFMILTKKSPVLKDMIALTSEACLSLLSQIMQVFLPKVTEQNENSLTLLSELINEILKYTHYRDISVTKDDLIHIAENNILALFEKDPTNNTYRLKVPLEILFPFAEQSPKIATVIYCLKNVRPNNKNKRIEALFGFFKNEEIPEKRIERIFTHFDNFIKKGSCDKDEDVREFFNSLKSTEEMREFEIIKNSEKKSDLNKTKPYTLFCVNVRPVNNDSNEIPQSKTNAFK